MDSDFYCSLCRVDCIDGTGNLLHVLTEEHCIAYQSKFANCSVCRSNDNRLNKENNQRISGKCSSKSEELVQVAHVSSIGSMECRNLSDENPSQHTMKTTKSEFYCQLCSVNCVDNTGKFLHVLTEKHCQAYQSKMKVSSQNYPTDLGNEERDNQAIKGETISLERPILSADSELQCILGKGGYNNVQNKIQHLLCSEHNKVHQYQLKLNSYNQNGIETKQQKSKNKKTKKKLQKKRNAGKNIAEWQVFYNKTAWMSLETVNCNIPRYSNDKINPIDSHLLDTESNKAGNLTKNKYLGCGSNEKNDLSHCEQNTTFNMQIKYSQDSLGQRNKEYCKRIVVKGTTPVVDKMVIQKFFFKYGYIKSFEVIGLVFCIEYFERYSIERIFSEIKENKISINGLEFEIKENRIKSSKDFQIGMIPNDIKKMFSSRECFEKKIFKLLSRTDLGFEELEKQNSVCASVAECLKVDFNPTAHPFGSRVTGLATEKSDLDIYLEITHPPELLRTKQEDSTQEAIVRHSTKRLRACIDFKEVFAITNARTPIVQFLHKPTNLRCDLSFRAPFGLFNTALIKLYLSLDYRVKPLIVFIRYWSSVHGLAGRGKISNYCLSMMIIFYLQQIPIDPVLPSAAFLLNLNSENEKRKVMFWECGFCENISLIPKSANKSTFFQLLKGFFKFYFEFDANTMIICPFLGKAVEKSLFLPGMESELPKEFAQYLLNCKEKITKPLESNCILCVQDPLVLNHNTARHNERAILQNFQNYCGLYADVCDSVSKIENFSSVCRSHLLDNINLPK